MPPSRIPPLLQPYTRLPPQDSLTLLTSVLGASTNWLIVKFLYGALASGSADGARSRTTRVNDNGLGTRGSTSRPSEATDGQEDVAVILVSWLRDWEFWRTEARRGGGLDLARLAQQNRFLFIDGLASLFLAPPSEKPPATQPPTPQTQPPRASPLPVRPSPSITPRAPIIPRVVPPTHGSSDARLADSAQPTEPNSPNHPIRLTSPSLPHLETTIQSAITRLSNRSPRRVLLILDAPDLLLATALPPSPNPPSASSSSAEATTLTPTTPTTLHATIHAIRASVHATILALAADAPLLSPSHSNPTPLEAGHAAFLVSAAHSARCVVQLRLLDTGFARDVSGVVRVSRGDDESEEEDGEEDTDGAGHGGGDRVEEKEMLYFIQGDGGVRVFERG